MLRLPIGLLALASAADNRPDPVKKWVNSMRIAGVYPFLSTEVRHTPENKAEVRFGKWFSALFAAAGQAQSKNG